MENFKCESCGSEVFSSNDLIPTNDDGRRSLLCRSCNMFVVSNGWNEEIKKVRKEASRLRDLLVDQNDLILKKDEELERSYHVINYLINSPAKKLKDLFTNFDIKDQKDKVEDEKYIKNITESFGKEGKKAFEKHTKLIGGVVDDYRSCKRKPRRVRANKNIPKKDLGGRTDERDSK